MRKSNLCALALIPLCCTVAEGKEYRGPKCLGPFCIGDYGPGTRMFQQLGPPSQRLDMYCYEFQRTKAFLRVEMENVGSNQRIVAEVNLSDFSTCMHVPKGLNQITADDLCTWRTPEGVGLGSTEEDVIRAYGKPDYERQLDSKTYHLAVPGYRKTDSPPPVGGKMLVYKGREDESRCTWFGIRNGRVAWINLSQ